MTYPPYEYQVDMFCQSCIVPQWGSPTLTEWFPVDIDDDDHDHASELYASEPCARCGGPV